MTAIAPDLSVSQSSHLKLERMILPGGNPNYSVFDRRNRSLLQKMILDGEVDSDTLLPDVLDYIETNYYNLFCNLDTGKHSASPYAVGGILNTP